MLLNRQFFTCVIFPDGSRLGFSRLYLRQVLNNWKSRPLRYGSRPKSVKYCGIKVGLELDIL
jgi:hypothetical protein